jgi:predicted component of viral defense system (DUF524 family)
MDLLQVNSIGQDDILSYPIPSDLRSAFSPATHCLYEWTEYWLEYHGADRLRLVDTWLAPKVKGWFCVRFENQLGLATLQPYAGTQPSGPPLYVEVISSKFPKLDQHLSFYRGLLNDLFDRAARLPFTFSSPTGRSVTEALRPPTPLFTLHFLCQYAPTLRNALAIVQAAPHRQLRDDPALVPLAEATEADADVLLSILRAPQEWVSAGGFLLAKRLKGYAPARVWQRRPEETTDTPENRFVLAFLRQVLTAAEMLPAQQWWSNVPIERQTIVRETAGLLRQAIVHPLFADVGPLHHLPLTSQVLLRRDGYRELLVLWQRFHQARRPLFAPLQRAIDVRDIAKLYEMWAFWALVEEIAVQVQESPSIDLRLSDESGLEWQAEARFGAAGTLVYNRQYQPPYSYSVPLRPDFTWVRQGQPEVVLDAKFRLERLAPEDTTDDSPEATARRADLYKMHTYRDALGVRAAISIYPGDISIFYDRTGEQYTNLTLRDLLLGDCSGIGAIAMSPHESSGRFNDG